MYHDKEKILDGELTFRKVVLQGRPRIRVRRDAAGRWNLAGLTGKSSADRPVPTMVFHQAVIVVEDQFEGAQLPAFEIRDVNVTLLNETLPNVTFRGVAKSEEVGDWRFQGLWHRPTGEISFGFHIENLSLQPRLIERAGGKKVEEFVKGLQLSARADMEGSVSLRANPYHLVYYDVTGKVRQGKLQHPLIPIPLADLTSEFSVHNGEVRVETLKATAGGAQVQAKATGSLPRLEQNFEADVEIRHLDLCDDLAKRLPMPLQNLHALFQPKGRATLAIHCARREGEWHRQANGEPSRLSLKPEHLGLAFKHFPLPLSSTVGTVDYNLLEKSTQVDINCMASDRPVFIRGYWRGEAARVKAQFDIHATDIPIDEPLLNALPPEIGKFARSFHPSGKIDVKSHIQRDVESPEYHNEYHVRFRDTAICWERFPLPLEKVDGIIDVYPKHWDFHDFRANHKGGEVKLFGHCVRTVNHGEPNHDVKLEIHGKNVPFDSSLSKALDPIPGLSRAYGIFRPEGRLNFKADIHRPTSRSEDLEVKVQTAGVSMTPTFFPLRMQDVSGDFHYQHHRLNLASVRAWHGDTLLSMDRGHVDLHLPGGGFYADLADIQAQGLVFDQNLVQALPAKLREAAKNVQPEGPMKLKTQLVLLQASEPGSPTEIFWDGQLWFDKNRATLGMQASDLHGTLTSRGRYNGRQLEGVKGNLQLSKATLLKQPFENFQANYLVPENAPDVLLVGLRAPLYDGDITGRARVDFNSTLRYYLDLTASQIDLEKFAKQNLTKKSNLSGKAMAQLLLAGQGSGIDSLEGNGTLDIPGGQLYNLPFLFDLLKFLGLHFPDRTAFEELHAVYRIQGKRVKMSKLDLTGNAISLAGQGEFNLDGTDLQLDFFPVSKAEPFLPPAVRPLGKALSKGMLTIEMRGQISEDPNAVRFQKRFLPIVFDPVDQLRKRILQTAESKNP